MTKRLKKNKISQKCGRKSEIGKKWLKVNGTITKFLKCGKTHEILTIITLKYFFFLRQHCH